MPFNLPGVICLLGIAGICEGALVDPVPEPLPSEGVGVKVVPFVQIPDSPSTGNPPRLNMLREAPDGSGRLFVIDQLGYLYVIQPDKTVSTYLNLPTVLGSRFRFYNSQTGSSSFAFHPDFSENGKFYLVTSSPAFTGTPDFLAKRPIDPSRNGTDPRTPPFHDILLEFTATDPSANAFAGTFREVIRFEQPYGDHNVGEVAFNPVAMPGHADYGLLFVAVADGGNKFPIEDADPENNGQDLTTILGTIIRIDPLGSNAANGKYGIPADNPFAKTDGPELREIWSYGHRNHHRMAWDSQGDQALYSFEMGQATIEEVNRIVAGGNYGWGIREGTFVIPEFNENALTAIPDDEVPGTFQYPVFQYDHPTSNGAIAGGAVYRGSEIPSLYGKVILADFTGFHGAYYGKLSDIGNLAYGQTALLYRLDIYDADGLLSDLSSVINGPTGTRRTDLRISTDSSGEVYFLNKRNGWIHRLSAAPGDTGGKGQQGVWMYFLR